jgi:type II restriction/modification system DNA methylase subunit YeeA
MTEKGDVVLIAGKPFPKAIGDKRKRLEDRIKRNGFEQTMEAMAYTWFNRLVAIRFMELHGYLEHGYRVLSHPEGKPTPEILEHAEHVELQGLKKEAVIDLKLAGNKEGELYRLLLTAQCNALHTAMPFLFERIDDETELLLPDNLLNSDSLMRKLVGEIEEEDWNEVEIIGWMYQFYISEKKDEVIGKVVASEDIPAATQLFTPNWIVKYLVQNTLGRQWLATYPQSALRQQMEYYIEPAEQTPEVQEKLTAITPTSLNPEELTLLDPACGSGHILVEAYDLLKAIYQERGYRAKDIPALILQKNLFGMEIDDRAAQLAAFALMMKARADDRRIFDSEAKPNILAFEDSQGMKASEVHFALTSPLKGEKEGELESPTPDGHLFEPDDNLFTRAEAAKAASSRTPTTLNVSQGDIAALLELFENAKTFGSLIQVPLKLAAKLPDIEKRLDNVLTNGDLTHASAHVVKPLLQQARLLSRQYDAVVANPPYMNGKFLTPLLKQFTKSNYLGYEKDLFSAFIVRNLMLANSNGFLGFMSPFVWMFISSYEKLRLHLIDNSTISTLIQLEYSGFDGATVPICTFTLGRHYLREATSSFIKLSSFRGSDVQAPKTLEAIHHKECGWFYEAKPLDFKAIPGNPIAFWVSGKVPKAFRDGTPLRAELDIAVGLFTCNNARFLRRWFEIDQSKARLSPLPAVKRLVGDEKWFPYNKGGAFRKWYGNGEYVVMFQDNGAEIRDYRVASGQSRSLPGEKHYFKRAITWTATSSSYFGVRHSDEGFIFDVKGSSGFAVADHHYFLGFLTSSVVKKILDCLNPTIETQTGDIGNLPVLQRHRKEANAPIKALVEECIEIARNDWDSCEMSWDFESMPLIAGDESTVEASYVRWTTIIESRFARMKELEEENNRLFIEAYGLQDELSPEVPDDQITLYRPDRSEDIKRLISYAIGCMMGRYSLDKPGLIYAHSGNQGFDASQYMTFRADDDGIMPLLETDWGIRDDATNRFVEFIGAAWSKEHLEENLKFVADSLGPTGSEQPRDTIRRYLAIGFYKHHLPMYKKRPIYWLFSSGKQRAFQCLVYLHRYHEGTLARMRTEYVIPLQGQIAARIEQLEGDKSKATSTSHRNKLQKEQTDLKKQQAELLTFEEKLKHAADKKISLDLDDGVKVNYAKFGDLLAESKAITGGKDDE